MNSTHPFAVNKRPTEDFSESQLAYSLFISPQFTFSSQLIFYSQSCRL